MIKLVDQLGRDVNLRVPAKRIVSLVPSLTELLFDLHLNDRIVGRTKFCIHTKETKPVPIIGGTKNINIDSIKNLQPDLIIANKEENPKEIIEELYDTCPVYVSNIQTIHSALKAISDIGILTDTSALAEKMISDFETSVQQFSPKRTDKSCIYLIWENPIMTIGKDTYINNMLRLAGFQSVIHDYRYPTITEELIAELNPEYILLSSEPYPFKSKHLKRYQELFQNSHVILVDGTYFSWYGSRIISSIEYFKYLDNQLTQENNFLLK